MYTVINFKSKKAMKEAVADKTQQVRVYQPGGLFNVDPDQINGRVAIEGPHYPQAHSWYASVEVKAGIITKVVS